jgi:regulator of protease activity HflC (stomatin/prohibitin superfamily)
MQERPHYAPHGLLALVGLLVFNAACIAGIIYGASTRPEMPVLIVASVLALMVGLVCLAGFFIVNPNEGRVLQFFGSYVGTVKDPGLRWANPFYTKRHVSLRVNNFESQKLKVNDHAGNPIEIGAVVVWKVVDTAEACFHVENYQDFVHVQSEAALRNLATRYPYDAHGAGEIALRSHTDEIADKLKAEIQSRLTQAGVQVIESRISHLAYAPEIAGAMLRRQQAAAVVAARQKIVEGAVGMVEMALKLLSEQHIVEFDAEKKATMVSNLLVVLCGDRDANPVVNVGSLYQ